MINAAHHDDYHDSSCMKITKALNLQIIKKCCLAVT